MHPIPIIILRIETGIAHKLSIILQILSVPSNKNRRTEPKLVA